MTESATPMPRHRFIAIEGLKGSGKTSVSSAIAERYGARLYTTPPPLFRPIRDAVEAGASPVAKYLYYCSGLAQAAWEIEAVLSERPVVCDKFTATLLAYSRANGIDDELAWFKGVVQPDIAFRLDVPTEVRLRRVIGRGDEVHAAKAYLAMEERLDVNSHWPHENIIAMDNGAEGVGGVVRAISKILDGET